MQVAETHVERYDIRFARRIIASSILYNAKVRAWNMVVLTKAFVRERLLAIDSDLHGATGLFMLKPRL
jgi:hypothetical protein